MARTNPKTIARLKRVRRIRKKLSGTAERPRLRVFKSNKHIYAQIIDDAAGKTLAALDYQHYVDRQLEPVADGILGFVGTSFRTLVDKQITLF